MQEYCLWVQRLSGISYKKEHEKEFCRHRPFSCPAPHCSYKGPKFSLFQHFYQVHQIQTWQIDSFGKAEFTMKSTDAYKLLQSDQEVFLVHHEIVEFLGDVFFCTSFGSKRIYQLKVELKSESRCHGLRTAVHQIGRPKNWKQRFEDWKLKRDFLVVPNAVQVEPRTTCQYDLELEFLASVGSTSNVA